MAKTTTITFNHNGASHSLATNTNPALPLLWRTGGFKNDPLYPNPIADEICTIIEHVDLEGAPTQILIALESDLSLHLVAPHSLFPVPESGQKALSLRSRAIQRHATQPCLF